MMMLAFLHLTHNPEEEIWGRAYRQLPNVGAMDCCKNLKSENYDWMKNYHKGGSQTLFYEPSAVRKRAVKGGQVSSSLTLILVMFPMTRVMMTMTRVMLMEMMVMLMIAVPMLTMTMVRLMEIMVRMMEMMVISRRASSLFSSPPLPWPGKRQRWRWISTPPSQGHKAPRPCLRNNLFTFQLKRKVMMIKMLMIMMKMTSILHLFSCQAKLLA